MKFIEKHNLSVDKSRVSGKFPRQHAFSQKPQFGVGARLLFEANLIPDAVSKAFATLLGGTARRHASRYPARFEHIDVGESGIEQCWRNTCRFAGPRLGLK
jgi:hypothetical protein